MRAPTFARACRGLARVAQRVLGALLLRALLHALLRAPHTASHSSERTARTHANTHDRKGRLHGWTRPTLHVERPLHVHAHSHGVPVRGDAGCTHACLRCLQVHVRACAAVALALVVRSSAALFSCSSLRRASCQGHRHRHTATATRGESIKRHGASSCARKRSTAAMQHSAAQQASSGRPRGLCVRACARAVRSPWRGGGPCARAPRPAPRA